MNRSHTSESIRIRQIRECVERAVLASKPRNLVYSPPGCACKMPIPQIQNPTTMNSHSYTLKKAVECLQTYTQPNSLLTCIYTDPLPPFSGATEDPQGPGVAVVTRQFTSIRGIDAISKSVALQSGSSRTSQIRSNIQAQTDRNRYPNTVIPLSPYPACVPWRTTPQPGVPIAPNSPCNPGSRRVA